MTVVTAASTADLLASVAISQGGRDALGESRQFSTPAGRLTIEAIKVQHWGARVRHDVHRGFNGYVLEREAAASASPATRR